MCCTKKLLKDVMRAFPRCQQAHLGLMSGAHGARLLSSPLLSVSPTPGAPRVAPAPVLPVTHQNSPYMRLMRRLTLHIVPGSARSDPAGGEFTRTATPNGAHRGSGSQWAHRGGNDADKMEIGGGKLNNKTFL